MQQCEGYLKCLATHQQGFSEGAGRRVCEDEVCEVEKIRTTSFTTSAQSVYSICKERLAIVQYCSLIHRKVLSCRR